MIPSELLSEPQGDEEFGDLMTAFHDAEYTLHEYYLAITLRSIQTNIQTHALLQPVGQSELVDQMPPIKPLRISFCVGPTKKFNGFYPRIIPRTSITFQSATH
jgi:hypothetical protein